MLKNALGSQEKAARAMSDIETLAAKTPFSVDELTDSYIKYVNRGLNPSMTEMSKLADIAASQGKSFDQLTEAVLDAGSGEFERLKEFGIKASKSGEEVSLSFKGVNQTVKNTPEAINGAIMAFGSMQGVAGSTAAISATLEGKMSNLGDQSDQLEKKVGNGLKPVFNAIITVFGVLMGWFSRFLDNLGPVGNLFNALGKEIQGVYVEIRDVIEGMGLFNGKTDTVKLAVGALVFVLTALTFGTRTVLSVVRGLADGFIYLYNKSELVRGVLGGLAAVVTTTFKTIKDDALKYLGGVGDILVGIFTLDVDKIKAGFKATMDATVDMAFTSGLRNAQAFMNGYNSNKNNKITRSVTVNTETSGGEEAPAGGEAPSVSGPSGPSAAEREKARKEAEKHRKQELAEQKKHDQQRLKATKEWVKEEGALLEYRDAFMAELGNRAMSDGERKRVRERDKIFADATKKVEQLTGLEVDYTDKMKQIVEDRDLQLRELTAKYAEEEEKRRQEALDVKLANEEATAAEQVAQLELDLANGVMGEAAFEDAVFLVKQSAAARELDLLKQKHGVESAEVKKKNAQILKAQADHVEKTKGLDLGMRKFQEGIAAAKKVLGSEEVAMLSDLFGKKSGLYKAFVVAQKALALTEIGMNLATEMQQNAKAASQNPFNGVTAGAAGIAQLERFNNQYT